MFFKIHLKYIHIKHPQVSKSLFEQVVTDSQIQSSVRGYFQHDDVMVRKWVPYDESLVGDLIVQIVVPEKFREPVLKIAHEWLGYLWVLWHFFLARVEA